ncbi:MAG: hypothetical protein LLG15_10615 [Betaproteobacteria bacterium]|nr:hypothetical protein [Betaproteobacteria bacterium]
MKKNVRVVALILAAMFSLAAIAGTTLKPGETYYFDNFDPTLKPWSPGEGLNIEEVYKNYLYYEVVIDKAGRGITVNRYIQNARDRSDKYLVRPDGSLEAK